MSYWSVENEVRHSLGDTDTGSEPVEHTAHVKLPVVTPSELGRCGGGFDRSELPLNRRGLLKAAHKRWKERKRGSMSSTPVSVTEALSNP